MLLAANKGGRRHLLLYACIQLLNKPSMIETSNTRCSVCMHLHTRHIPLCIYGVLGVLGIRMLSHFDNVLVVQATPNNDGIQTFASEQGSDTTNTVQTAMLQLW